MVEVTDQADRPCVGCPHRKRGAAHRPHRAVILAHVRAQDVPELLVAALSDEVQIDLAQRRQETVGVVLNVLDTVVIGNADPVVRDRRRR